MPSTSPGRFSPRRLSLGAKSLLFVGGVVLVLMASLLVLVSTVFLESLDSMQSVLTKELVDGVVGQLNQVARQQQNKVAEGAVRDETFKFFNGKARGYLETNFDPTTNAAGQNIVLLFDRQKNPFAWLFLPEGLRKEKGLPSYLHADEARRCGLLQGGQTGSVVVAAPAGLQILSGHPVTRADGSGPSPGWLVYGQDIGRKWFGEMKELTGVSISPIVFHGKETGVGWHEGKTLAPDALGICRVFISPVGHSDEISAVIGFENSAGTAPAGLRLTMPSVVYSAAVELRNKLVWSSILIGVVLAAFSCFAIDHLFIAKINGMDREFQMLVDSEDSSGRLMKSSHDEFGRLAGSANQLLDAFRRRRVQLEHQESLLQSVLESASEGIMAFRSLKNEKGAISDFIIVLANKATERMMNRPARDMLGKCLLGLFPGNLSEGLFDRYVRVAETKIGEDFETFYAHEDIRSWFHISAAPWSDGLVITIDEISRRKRVEQELKASIEEMERFNRAMIGRENRVLEMKSEVNLLRSRMGLPPEYKVDSLSDEP